MEIEFYNDDEAWSSVRFLGDDHASNEVILGIFYEYKTNDEAKYLFADIDKVLRDDLSISLQKEYDFGDFICGELNKDHVILKPDGPITSKTYKLKTLDLKKAINEWISFRQSEAPDLLKKISINVEILA